MNNLEEEFMRYQLLDDSEIPDNVWNSALIYEEDEVKHFRIDKLWAYLRTAQYPDGSLIFAKLAKVALLVLTLPHSNAEEERVFSMVTKNKTKFRPNLKLDGTLSSILTIKLANPEPCHEYEPPKKILEAAKKATVEYNKEHKN